jgi:hypothetical protein
LAGSVFHAPTPSYTTGIEYTYIPDYMATHVPDYTANYRER